MKKLTVLTLTLLLAALMLCACRSPELPMSSTAAPTAAASTVPESTHRPDPTQSTRKSAVPHASGEGRILPERRQSYREY